MVKKYHSVQILAKSEEIEIVDGKYWNIWYAAVYAIVGLNLFQILRYSAVDTLRHSLFITPFIHFTCCKYVWCKICTGIYFRYQYNLKITTWNFIHTFNLLVETLLADVQTVGMDSWISGRITQFLLYTSFSKVKLLLGIQVNLPGRWTWLERTYGAMRLITSFTTFSSRKQKTDRYRDRKPLAWFHHFFWTSNLIIRQVTNCLPLKHYVYKLIANFLRFFLVFEKLLFDVNVSSMFTNLGQRSQKKLYELFRCWICVRHLAQKLPKSSRCCMVTRTASRAATLLRTMLTTSAATCWCTRPSVSIHRAWRSSTTTALCCRI